MISKPTILDDKVIRAVANFSVYCDEIQSIISSACGLNQHDIKTGGLLPSILNGRAASALQRLVPIGIRKEAGLFFTSSRLAEKVAERLAPMLQSGSKLLDPACGAGNLLLACARFLPRADNLRATLKIWSKLILGYDLHFEFIRAARLRLALLALNIHPRGHKIVASLQPDQIFSGLKEGDGLAHLPIGSDTCIALNSPFGHIQAPVSCEWATGKIQIAAWFLDQLLHGIPDGLHIVAILPDVLRSGTRYRNWRNMITSRCCSVDIEPAGRFDDNTDVDVFIMHAVTGTQGLHRCRWPAPRSPIRTREHIVSDFFDVRVGTVVPHREPLKGPRYPYIHARTAPAWQTIDSIPEKRQYSGTVFKPPFLVVHRTSSPSDKHRCVANIVKEKQTVAVENHLLILLPRDKSLKSCEQLFGILKSPQTHEWLNTRIRCRHLTVSAISELPCCAVGPPRKQKMCKSRR